MPNLRPRSFSTATLLVFLGVFAAVGFVIYRLFAATSTPAFKFPTLEAERMRRHSYTKVFTEPVASGRRAVFIYRGHSSMTGTFRATAAIGGFNVIGRDTRCRSTGHPSIRVVIARAGRHASLSTVVGSQPYRGYKRSNLNLPAGAYRVTIYYQTYSSRRHCQAQLYLDAVQFTYKPTFGTTSLAKSKKSTDFTTTVNTHGLPAQLCYFDVGKTITYGTKVACKALPKAVTTNQTMSGPVVRSPAGKYNYRPCLVINGIISCGTNQLYEACADGSVTKNTCPSQNNSGGSGGHGKKGSQHQNSSTETVHTPGSAPQPPPPPTGN